MPILLSTRQRNSQQPGQQYEKSPHSGCDKLTHEQTPGSRWSSYFTGLSWPRASQSHKAPQLGTARISDHSKQPVHSFFLLGWETWLMTWQKSSMQIANICHSASTTPYIYLLILLNISAYYQLCVGGGQWCMFLHDPVQKKAISCKPRIHSWYFF